jgi:S-DNA-T family DNA segregation ATPase FtsK/SpoIIIE
VPYALPVGTTKELLNMSMRFGKCCQISGFLLLVAMLFAGFSVYSYSPEDPAWNQYVSDGQDHVQNLGGAVGAALADIGLQGLGSSVVLLLGMGLWAGWSLMRQRLQRTVEVVCRGLILVAAVSTGTHIMFGQDPFFGPAFLAGGVSGQWLAAICLNYFNTFGALLISLAAVVLSLFVGVNFSIRSMWRRQVGTHILQMPNGLRRGRPYPQLGYAWLRRAVAGCISTTQRSWQWLLQWLDDGEEGRRERPAAIDPLLVDDDEEDWEIDDGEEEAIEEGSTGDRPVAVPAVGPPRSRPTVKPAIEITPAESTARWRAKRKRGRESDLLPPLDLLDEPEAHTQRQAVEELEEQARFLEEKLGDFGITGEVVHVQQGPVITMFEYAPAAGIKVSRIVNLQDDLALVLRALSVRVVAPIPGKAAVGIEVPNKYHEIVRLREVLNANVLPPEASKLSLALGRDITGAPFVTDLAKTPHLLIAGATGAGKSVGLNCMICSMLFRATPEEVRLIMIDPKMLELSIYEGVPHLLVPVVTNPKQAALALRRVVEEMERRYQLLAAKGVRNIAQYNDALEREAAAGHTSGRAVDADMCTEMYESPMEEKLPYLVVVIDELSDLMMVSSKEVEDSLTRIAQMARAAGIHLIVATQRPSVDVLTGVIKANFPARLSFQVTSKTDSRTILDANGAEKLLGRGDMLFLAPGTSKPQRAHSAFVSEAEINRLVEAWKRVDQPQYDERFLVPSEEQTGVAGREEEEYDEKYDEAVALVAATGQASISMVQRRLRVGYNRAARMIEIMEKEGLVGPSDGVKPREVLVRKSYDFDRD